MTTMFNSNKEEGEEVERDRRRKGKNITKGTYAFD